jgi:hypothetical protein
MQDHELSELLQHAARAGQRMDTARAELAFETRMAARLAGTEQLPGPAVRFQLWLRGPIGLAAATGIAAALFISTRGTAELDDTLAAFWSGQTTMTDATLFD